MSMKCKRCGFKLTETEEDDILAARAEGLRPQVLCEDCWEVESSMEEVIDDVSDADPGL